MPWDWPVVINYHEAKAYCNWLGQGFRLITEAEHHAIRDPEVCRIRQYPTISTSKKHKNHKFVLFTPKYFILKS